MYTGRIICWVLLGLVFPWKLSGQSSCQLRFDEALRQMSTASRGLKIAEQEVRIAHDERSIVDASWYPQVQTSGMYVHLSEDVEVKQKLSRYTNPIKEHVHELFPSDVLISEMLDKVGSYTLSFPLLPRDLSTLDVTAEWVAFSGGDRLLARRIGGRLISVAEENRSAVKATELVALVESYYGLFLIQQTIEVRRLALEGMKRHYFDAIRLEKVGMIDKAARLVAQVAYEEARSALEAARMDEQVGQLTLRTLLGISDDTVRITPVSPLFVNEVLPPYAEFAAMLSKGNPAIKVLALQEAVAGDQLRMSQSDYLPNVALFAKHTIWSHGIPSNLFPRSMVGVGFTWNLFDGLAREKRIVQSRQIRQSLVLEREKVEEELAVTLSELYVTLEKARADADVWRSVTTVNEELLRVRTRAFKEGLATTAELIDAETMLADARLAHLASCYAYDVALINLLALCGTPEVFTDYSRMYE